MLGRRHTAVAGLSLCMVVTLFLAMTPLVHAGIFIVDDVGDAPDGNTGDGVCDDGAGNCTLRAAIQQANAMTGPHTIAFTIPGCGAVCTIQPGSQLPTLAGGITVDGMTQTESQGDTNPDGPEIELDGSFAGGGAVGFYLQGNLNQVRGLVINRFGGAGIYITQGMTNTVGGCYIGTDVAGTSAQGNNTGIYLIDDVEGCLIGGSTPQAGNLISGNSGSGVVIEGAHRNRVWGNIIGADRTGHVRLPNAQYGVQLTGGAQYNWVGGDLPEYGNLLSGNNADGLRIEGEDTMINSVGGNTVGLNIARDWPLHNGNHGIGIYNGASNNIVGSSTLVPNVIGGNGWSGVVIVNGQVNAVHENFIGTNEWGTPGLGNNYHGVHIVASPDNSVGADNVIAYNGLGHDGDGVRVEGVSAIHNYITENSIHHNDGLGINLVNGGNANRPPPVIDSASCTGVSGTACVTCTVEIFSDSEDEGQFVQRPPVTIVNPSTGAWSWSGDILGPNVTSTATDALLNTSEFSTPVVGVCYRLHLPYAVKRHP